MLMLQSISSEGKEYISAIRAAKKTGYASDYIGQLCRAKKIPAQLIGRTWYVDFASLVEHKKHRQFGKVKKLFVSESKGLAGKGQTLNTDSQGLTLKSETLDNLNRLKFVRPADEHDKNFLISSPIILPRFLNKPIFTYENDDRPRLPELSKKIRYVEPLWTSALTKQAVALTLSLLVAISAGFLTLEHTNTKVAMEIRQRLEDISSAPMELLPTVVKSLSFDNLQFTTVKKKLVAAVSFSDFFSNLVDGLQTSFRNLKQIALDKFFFSSAPPQLTYVAPDTPPTSPSSRALTNYAPSINLGSLKSELKSELESYVRTQISAIRPLVVYTSAPGSIATTDFESFRTNEVLPDIHYHITNQSNSDVERNSINLSNITDGGTFTNASISNSTFSGSSVNANTLSFTNADGVSATTTNLFSTNATFTNLFGVTLGLTDFSFTSATGTSATTTNFFSTTASSTNLFSSLLTVAGNGLIVDSSRNVGIGTSTPFGNGLFTVGTSSTNFYIDRASGNVGIGTTTPESALSVVGGISATGLTMLGDIDLNNFSLKDTSRTRMPTYGIGNIAFDNYYDGFSLSDYSLKYITNDLPVVTSDLSGVAYSGKTNTLFGVKNTVGSETIYEFNIDGTWKRTITLVNFLDPEGIAWMYGDTFAVVQERTAAPYLVIITIGPTTTTVDRSDSITITPNITITDNKGMEGVTYDVDNNIFYVAVEKQANASAGGRVFSVTIGGVATELTTLGTALSGAGYTDLGDIYYDRNTKKLFLVAQENNKILETSTTTILSSISTPASFSQPEGISFTPDGSKMFISSEPDDLAVYVRNPYSYAIQINDGNTTTGNVGIGTTTPYSKLSVWGAGTGSGQTFAVVNSASTTLLQVLDNGNVGIGTTSPYAKLSVVGETVSAYFTATTTSNNTFPNLLATNSTTTNATSTNFFATTASSTNLFSSIASLGSLTLGTPLAVTSGGTGQLSFGQGWLHSDGTTLTSSTSPTVAYLTATSTTATSTFAGGLNVAGTSGLTVLQNGRVGIGTTSPIVALSVEQISSNITAPNGKGIYMARGDGGYATIQLNETLGGMIDFSTAGSDQKGRILYDLTNNYFAFNTNSTEKVRINSSGNVGIGTTTPTWLLNPSSATASQLALSAGAGISQWAFRNAGGNLYFATTTVAGTATSSLSALTIDSNGNVGVATTSPAAGFAVATHCVTGDTRLRRRKKRKGGNYDYDEVMIKDVEVGDEILTINENTGKMVWSRVNALMDMGEKQIYKLTTVSGKEIRTTDNHPYLVQKESEKIPIKPKLGVFYDNSNMFYAQKKAGWKIDFAKLKKELSKSFDLEFVNFYTAVPVEGDPAREKTLKYISFVEPFVNLTTKPLKYVKTKKEVNGQLVDIINKKGDMDVEIALDVTKTIDDLDVVFIVSGDSDLLPIKKYATEKGKKIIFASFENNMAWELFYSKHILFDKYREVLALHQENDKKITPKRVLGVALLDIVYSKAPSLSSGGVWTKVKDIKEGNKIGVFDGKKSVWDVITKIEIMPEERVYDIEVEGTHNFIGNDIIAHNTYLGGNLTVQGNTNLLGNSTTTSATTTNAFVTSLLSTSATSSSLFSTTASSTNLYTSLFTLAGNTLTLTSNTTMGGTNTGDVTLDGTPDYLTISGQTITRNKLDISDDTNATGGLGLTLTANDFACDTADTGTFGCLTSTDWNTFNTKLGSYDAWTHPAYGGSATTSLLTLSGGFLNTAASSTIVGNLLITGNSTTTNATTTNSFATTASSTNFFSQLGTIGSLTLGTPLAVTSGGTGQLSFGQGWLHSDGATLTSSTSPTVAYLTATSTTATSTFAGGFFVGTSSPNFMVDAFTGRVGIGTTSPMATLAIQNGSLSLPNGTSVLPSLRFNDNYKMGFYMVQGTYPTIGVAANNGGDTAVAAFGRFGWGLTVAKSSSIGWTSSDNAVTGTIDVNLNRDAAYTLALKGGTAAQTFNIYATTTDTSNYERLSIAATNNLYTFGSQVAGYGTARNFNFTGGNVGIGTTTPTWLLNPTSATASQLALSAGAGFSQWAFRNAGGNLYFATTTVAGTATSSLSALTIDSNGNVGVATTSPVAGFAVATHCVTGDTKLRRRKRRKSHSAHTSLKLRVASKASRDDFIYDEVRIDEIKEGDEIQSLDEKTGKLVWSRVNKLMYMGEKEIWKITTESGKTIRTTSEHPYLVKTSTEEFPVKPKLGVFIDGGNMYHTSNRSGWRIDFAKLKNLLSQSADLVFINYHVIVPRKNDENYQSSISHIKIASKIFIIKEKLMKYIWDERVGKEIKKGDVDVDLAIDVVNSISELDVAIVISGDSDYLALENYTSQYGKPIIFMGYKHNMAWELRLKNHIFLELLRKFIEYGVKTNSDLSAGATLTSSIIHKAITESTVAVDKKDIKGGVWTKAKAVKEGQYIAIKGENDEAKYDKIVKIERLPEEQVYDIEVKGTHNFIGNDIIAHNTYLGGNLTVQGNTNLLGNSTTTSATTTNAFVTSLLSTSATSSSLFSTTASSTNLYTSLFTLAGNTLTLTSNTTMGGTNTGDVTLDGTPDYITISGQTITRNKLDISDDTNATGGVGITLTANDFACDTADTGTFGCLTSTDWNTFNTKLSSYDAWTHPAYGGSATTSLLTLSGGFLNTAASSTIVGNLLITGNSTTTNATTTNFFATTASSTNSYSSTYYAGNGSVSAPAFSFAGDTDTGLYVTQADVISFATGGILRATLGGNFIRVAGGVASTPAFSSTNDSNTGMYFPAADSIGFSLGGAEKIRINSSGDVGIGTTSPYAKLSVVGGTSGTALAVDTITGFSGNLLDLKVASTTKFVINQNGDFIASGNSTTTNATSTNSFATNASSTNLYSQSATLGSLTLGTPLAVTSGGTGQLSFGQGWLHSDGTTLTSSTSPTVAYLTATSTTATSTFAGGLTVDGTTLVVDYSSGNVGIGKANPGYKLEVAGGSVNTDAGQPYRSGGNWLIGQSSNIIQIGSSVVANDVRFDSTSGSGIIMIKSSGNVGIGTTTPTWLLNPTSATASQLALSAGAGVSQWAFRNAGGNLYIATTTVAGTATSSVSALSIDSNGLLTLPAYGGATGCAQFDTVGLLSNTGTACGTGGGTFSWTPTAYGVSTSTTLGFLNGFLSTASSTINSNLTITGNSTTTNATTTNAFVTSLLSTSATSSSLFSTTASSTNLFSSLLTVGGNGLVVDSSRNIGIGIAAPTGLLHLNQTPGDLSDNPTISFGDGDSGFYEGADDQMFLSLNTFPLYSFNTTSFQGIANSNGASLSAAAASNVIPTLQPDRTDTNTGLGWNGADQLSLIAGGVEWLRLDNIGSQAFFPTGNVGIGTTTPGYKLDVNGDVNVATGSAYKYNGVNALFASTTLGNFFFANAGNLTTTGTYNYGIGDTVLDSLTSGGQNIAIGRNAGTSINSGAGNTIYGYLAGATLSTGSNNVAIGASALNLVSTVDDLTAIGVAALENNTSGVQNTAVGRDAGRYISTGSYNTAIGNSALSGNSANKITGSSNTAIGRYAMGVTITTAANNTSIGMNSLFSNTTGADNVAIGLSAGTTNTTGTKNTLIGATADVASATLTNATAIGYGAIVGASNSLVLGGTGANAVNVGIGTTTPTWLLNPTSATAPQLSLSAGAGVSQWAFRNAGGNLYLATTTVAGTATSSVSSLSINSNGLLTLPSYGGVTGCAQFDTVGLLSNTGTACGTGGGGTDPFTHPTAGVSATTSSMIFTNASSTFTGDLNITGNSTTTNATTTNFFSTTASSTNLFSSLLTVAGNGLIVDSNRNVGIGTTTPYAKLSIAGTAGQTSPLFQVASSTNSPFFSITSAGDIGIGTTSPFARLSVTGNVALDSNMISFASTSASTLTLNYFASATSTIPNNKLYAWTIATSTTASPIFRIDTTSSSLGSISATTSIKGGFTLDDGAFNYDSYAGITSVDSLSTGPMAFDDNAGILSWIDMPVSTTTADIVMSYSAQLAGTPILTVYGESLGTGGGIKNGRIGIGTTSPYALLSLATTTNQLIDLFVISTSTAGLVFKVDSYGRTFGDGAYSSPAADYAEYFYTKSANLKSGEIVCVDILENNAVKRCERGADNNVMGIVSTKPAVIGNYIKAAETDPSHYTIIGMLGQVDAYVSNENGPINVGDSLTSASSTPGFAMHADGGDSTVGIALESMASSTGKIKVLISRRNKSLVVEEVEALVVERVAGMKIEDKVGQMIKQSVDSLDLDPKITAIARDEAEQAIARLNESFDNLKIQTLASTTLSLSLRLDDIESVFATTSIATSTATSTDESFAGKFFTNLFARITVWLADAANGIGDFFANRVRTKELCVSDESGAETCLSKAQLDALLWNVVSSDTPEETVVEEPAPLAPSDVGAPTEDVGVAEESVEEEEPIVEESVVEESVVEEPVIESVIDVPVTEESIQEPISEPEPEPVSAPAPELVPEPPAVETITP